MKQLSFFDDLGIAGSARDDEPLGTGLVRSLTAAAVPLVIAYGLGVDSTAVLVGLHQRGIRPDAILFADVGAEKQETYDYLPVIDAWLRSVGFPPVTVVRYVPEDFKNYPPYRTIEENCLTNGTLPSLAFGFKSCSLKWKVAPQNRWTEAWQPAVAAWRRGQRVLKVIGYDASPKDRKRYSHAVGLEDPQYRYWYPLIEWDWNRHRCKDEIRKAGLPVPPKSACIMCPATTPDELREFRKSYLRRIVIIEARAAPRLMGLWDQARMDAYNAETYPKRLTKWEVRCIEIRETGKPLPAKPLPYRVGDGTAGLWRSRTKSRPAMMTDFIRAEGLLPSDEIDMLIARAPTEILDRQAAFANGEEIPDWHDFLEQFTPEDGLEDLSPCNGCSGCTFR